MSSNLLDLISVNDFYNGLPKYFKHIASVFEDSRSYSHVSDFARLALQALESSPKKGEDYKSIRSDLLSHLFYASLKTCQFDEAYSALTRQSDAALERKALIDLVTTILTASGPGTAGLQRILRYPFSLTDRLFSQVDEILVELAKKQLYPYSSLGRAGPVSSLQKPTDTPDYGRILQAYRIARNDFRGAAEVAYQTVCRMRDAREAPSTGNKRKVNTAMDADEEDDIESKQLRNELLSLINILACMEGNEAYILVDQRRETRRKNSVTRHNGVVNGSVNGFKPGLALGNNSSHDNRRESVGLHISASAGPEGLYNSEQNVAKRVIVTLEDLRREYQVELDRVAKLQRGDWEFGLVHREHEDDDVDMGQGGTNGRNEDVIMG